MTDQTPGLFPILYGYKLNEDVRALRASGVTTLIIGLPWEMIAPHEAQAQSNHSQTLRRLAERGGLGPCEAMAVLENRRWTRMPGAVAQRRLAALLAAYQGRQPAEGPNPAALPCPHATEG